MNYTLTIGWLYSELMSTYGDRGNIICLQKRCEWRGIDVEIKRLDLGFNTHDLRKCDLLFMGGAQDIQQKIVSSDFSKEKIKVLKEMIEDNAPGLYVCGAYQFLGKYYKEANGTVIDGFNILDLYTENPGENHQRLIGNIVIESFFCHPKFISGSPTGRQVTLTSDEMLKHPPAGGQHDRKKVLIGFENHGGRTYLGKTMKPLGYVTIGYGNNGNDKTEGAMYKNSFGTYLHGPILPKNPHFADHLIRLALEKKYQSPITISPLNDSLEWQAHNAILNKRFFSASWRRRMIIAKFM